MSLILVGCDSNDDSDDEILGDAERFIGGWSLVSAADMNGTRDQTAVFEDQGALSIVFEEGNMYSLSFNYTDPATDDLLLQGAYTLNTASNTIQLNITFGGLTVDLPLVYDFVDDDNVTMTTDGTTLGLLLGEDLEGNVVLTLTRDN